jgi:hypothetical protein
VLAGDHKHVGNSSDLRTQTLAPRALLNSRDLDLGFAAAKVSAKPKEWDRRMFSNSGLVPPNFGEPNFQAFSE